MKFTCKRDLLEKKLVVAERFTGKNATLPILESVLLESKGGVLNLSSTNLEYAASLNVEGKGVKSGKVSVPAKIISQLIQATKEDSVELEEKQGNLLIKTESKSVKINGNPVQDFPIIPKVKKAFFSELEGYSLKSGLTKVLPAVSLSEFKPELNGVLFDLSPKNVKLAATDTFRLAEYTIKSAKPVADSFRFILPSRTAGELARVLDEEEEVGISFGENQVLFELEGITITSRVVDGSFPDYGGIIPKSFDTEAVLARNDLVSNIQSSSIFASKLQEVNLHFLRKKLEVSTSNPEVGEYKTSVPASLSGKELKISFNHRYLLDALQATEGNNVFVGANSETTPALIRDNADSSYIHILMPIRFT